MKKFFTASLFLLATLFVFFLAPRFSQASATVGSIDPTSSGNYKAKLLYDGSVVNFGYFPTTNPSKQVSVTTSELDGYIWGETIGWVSLNCSNNSSCGSSNFKVSNTSSGVLSGYAWGENAGWVNFGPFANSATPSVAIDSTGYFSGFAWSENFGWIQFDCGVVNACVNTDWRYPSGTSGSGGGTGVVIIPPSTTGTSGTTTTNGTTDGNGNTVGATDAGGTTDTSGTTGTGFGTTSGGSTGSSGSTTGSGFDPGTSGGTGGFVGGFFSTGGGAQGGNNGASGSGASSGGQSNPNNPSSNSSCGSLSILNAIVCTVLETYHFTQESFIDVIGGIRNVLSTPEGDSITKIIAIVGLIFGALFAVLPVLFSTPLSFSEIVLIPYRLWSLLMTLFGLRKRSRPWGTVYDSVTKQPLDPVMVTLSDMDGKEIATSITDMDGRYGFLVGPGMYRITPAKTHYSFPSAKLVGKTSDEVYPNLYFGYPIEITQESEVITKNIPMDPDNFDWNEFAKRDQHLMTFYSKQTVIVAKVASALFSAGFTLSFIALVSSFELYNACIFALYVILFILRETGLKTRPGGKLVEKSGAPLSFGVVRVFTATSKTNVATRVADKYGTYYCLIQNGEYYVTIERKNADQSYTVLLTSPTIHVTNGFINMTFTI